MDRGSENIWTFIHLFFIYMWRCKMGLLTYILM